MKRTSTSPPYLSWCVTVRNCAKTLEATLQSLRERTPQAEIVIVDTCSSDATPEIAAKYADVFEVWRGPRGDWDKEMYAVDDMAAARQHTFELASGRWRAWADGDDRVVGGTEAQKLLEENGRWKPTRKGQEVVPHAKEIEGGDGAVGLEDFLAWTEREHPDVTMFWCPYLYMRDAQGNATVWTPRERFARWDDPKRFRWQEGAHEVLVPVGSYRPPRAELPHVLWVHMKDWGAKETEFSTTRHSKILLAQYERGEITFRRCRYLAGFARLLWPERELEFWTKALEVAYTDMDRYRGRIGLGDYYARRGLVWDALDHHAAAHALAPQLPDAWYAAGTAAFERDDWLRAVEYLRRGVKCEYDEALSEINPRDHAVRYPSLLSVALQRAAKLGREHGRGDVALGLLAEASEIASGVEQRPEVGKDTLEAASLARRARNAFAMEKSVVELHEAWMVLRKNDETQKALALVGGVPWALEDHPLAVAMETWARPIRKHLTSPADYDEFYNTRATGWTPLKPDMVGELAREPRTAWLVEEIKRLAAVRNGGAPLRVLDLGCCDGIVGHPILRACPGIEYVGVDVNERALEHFRALLRPEDQSRVRLEKGRFPARAGAGFDVIVAGEIIEHVQDPASWLHQIWAYLMATEGVLLVTTPWGSFDAGAPPEKTAHGDPRDERGHVRAYSAERLCRDLRQAGRVEEIRRIGDDRLIGDALVARVKGQAGSRPPVRPVAFAVAGALWDWNGSLVDRDGIGASEEMIVRMAEKLAPGRVADVYGPIPQPEVYKGVGYWPKAALRHVAPNAKIVVSRAPSWHQQIDAWTPQRHPLVLWLQDTYYQDLDAAAAERYETIVCVSRWHKGYTLEAHRGISPDKVKVAYNWVDRGHFQDGIRLAWKDLKKPHHFIYASSPDRGLVKLLELWPRILELYPDATLSLFYGWKGAQRLGSGNADAGWNKRYLDARRKYETLRHQKGVQEIGLVDHYRIAAEFQAASAWLYPTDFTETCCTNALKARAAGCVPVTSALAALVETAACPQATLLPMERDEKGGPVYPKGYDEAFLAGVRCAVETSTEARQAMAREALERFSWEAVEPTWKEILA